MLILTTPNVDAKILSSKESQEKLTMSVLLYRYKRHFKLLFSTFAANMIMIACYLRFVQTTITSLYRQDYFRIWDDRYVEFTNLSSIGTFFGGPFSTFVTGVFVDIF